MQNTKKPAFKASMLNDNDEEFVIKDYAKEERERGSQYSSNPSSTKRQDPGKVMRNSSSNIPKPGSQNTPQSNIRVRQN